METSTQNFLERRKNFMETFAGNPILTQTIPGIASKLFEDEFNITLMDPTYVPIVFTTGWTEVLKFVGSQEVDEFAIDVCGVSLEYVTEYSQTDKSTNIVPQLIHKRTPI